MKKLLSLMLCTALLLSMCPLAALAEEANASASAVIVEAEDNAEAATPPADEETGDNTEDADNEDVTAPDEAENDTADAMSNETEPANEAENIAEEEIALYASNDGDLSAGGYTYKIEEDSKTGEQYAVITGCTRTSTSITFPDTLGGYTVKKIGYGAFRGNQNLKSIVIPDSVIRIDDFAFSGCTNLSSVKLSRNLEELSYDCFRDCTALKTIDIPKTLTNCDNYPFAGSGLVSVTFEDGTTKIAEGLFGGCKELSDVVLPKTLTSLGANVFFGLYGIKKHRNS